MFHQNVSFYGLTFSVFVIKAEQGRQLLVTSEAPGRLFHWYYLHVVYDCLDERRKAVPKLAEAAGLIGYGTSTVEGGQLDCDAMALELMKRIVRKMRADHTWLATQAWRSAQALNYWVQRPNAKDKSKYKTSMTPLFDSQIDAILGLETRFYRAQVNYALDPDVIVVASRARLQPLLPRDHIPAWEYLVQMGYIGSGQR